MKQTLKELIDADRIDDTELRLLADELVAHMVIEEHVFYPRARQVVKELVGLAFEEHAVARFELARALMATGEEKKTRLKVLKELLEYHIEEEEHEIFPLVRGRLSARELEGLGARMDPMFEKAVEKGFEALVVSNGQNLRPATARAASAGPQRASRGARAGAGGRSKAQGRGRAARGARARAQAR